MEMKKQIEALLFSEGRKLNVEELSRLLGTKASEGIINSIKELKEYYEKIDSPLKVVEYGDGWKMTVKEKYLPLVRSINPHTELSKTTMETLAVIAWKSPVLQSTVIKIRTNKAYDHINELEEMGFVTREKYG
ncbi:MAG: SMC-Scp complex subunit ScpB, partial [Nanoarchaeota archaeon]